MLKIDIYAPLFAGLLLCSLFIWSGSLTLMNPAGTVPRHQICPPGRGGIGRGISTVRISSLWSADRGQSCLAGGDGARSTRGV
jgi:hypothetical protein